MKDKKEWLLLMSACVTLVSGITMSFLSFFLSFDHSINSSVLWYFAQSLMYAASAFGIAGYAHLQNLKINNFIDAAKRTLHN